MNPRWQAIILAGDRGPDDPVAAAAQTNSKASASVGGKMLVARVVGALKSATLVNSVSQCGPGRAQLRASTALTELIETEVVQWIAPESSPSRSAKKAASEVGDYPMLLITSDLPLILDQHIDAFCKRAWRCEADIVACAIPYSQIAQKIPELKKTRYQFAEEALCFANVFALRSKQSLRALEYWKQIEDARKRPLKIISMLGPGSLLRYQLGRLTLSEAAERLSSKVGATIEVVKMSIPELAIDVDSAEDFEIMDRYCRQ